MKKITDLSKTQQRVARTLYRTVEQDGGGYFLPMENWRAYCSANSITMLRVFQAAYEGLEIEEGKVLYATRTEDLSALPSTQLRHVYGDLHMLPGFMMTDCPMRRVYDVYTGEPQWIKA